MAVKITRASLLSGDDLRRFRNEAELVARLDHPGIVPLYEVGECDGHLYYSMKLVPGGDLSRHLDRLRHQPRAAAELLIDVARAVHHAHQRGILHRDLKPSNILLDERGQPHVADFGLARCFGLTDQETAGGSLTGSGELLGTPAYMAPEQASGGGRMLTTATDVYGLGAVLYGLLTGQGPFRGESAFDTLLRASTSDPPPPRQLNPAADRDLETICLKCLEREPARRYGSAEEVAADLARWLAGEPILARPTGTAQRLWRYCRRQPVVAALSLLAAVLLATLLAGLSGAVVMLQDEQARTDQQRIEAERHARLAQQRETAARRLLYVGDIDQAWRAFESSNLPRMIECLDRHIPQTDQDDLRGFEWHYLRRLSKSREALVSLGQLHNHQVFCVAYSPDGKRFATASEDRTVAVWDAATAKRLFGLQGFADDANWLVFTADGETLIASGEDGSIWRCNAHTGEDAIKIYQAPSAIPQIALSPDGQMLVAACWDGFVRRFAYPSMQELPSWSEPNDKIESVRFSPDGKTLIAAGRINGVKMWDAAATVHRHTLQGTGEFKSLAVAHHRTWAAACNYDGAVYVFDYESGEMIRQLTGHVRRVLSVAISPDDSLIATADDSGGIRVWELATGRLLDILPGEARVWCLTFTPDGREIAAVSAHGHVFRWPLGDWRWQRQVLRDSAPLGRLQFLPDRQSLVCLSSKPGEVILLDHASQQLSKETVSLQEPAIALAGNGQNWVVGHANGLIALWRRGEARPRWTVPAHQTWVHALAITTDGKTVLSGRADEPLRLWDAETGKSLGEIALEFPRCYSFALSSDGQTLALASFEGDLALIDWKTRNVKRRFSPPKAYFGEVMTLSPDTSLLAIAHENVIKLVKTDGSAAAHVLLGHTHRVHALAISPDNRTLASGSSDGTIRLWNTAVGQEVFALRGADENISVAFSSDGRTMLACGRSLSGQGELYAWEASSP